MKLVCDTKCQKVYASVDKPSTLQWIIIQTMMEPVNNDKENKVMDYLTDCHHLE